MQNCPKCSGRKWLAKISKQTGLQVVHANGRRVWKCWRCGLVAEDDAPFVPTIHRKTQANILYVDLEVAKSIYYSYGRNVKSGWLSGDDIIQEYFIISWVAKYQNNPRVWSGCVSPDDALDGKDKNILAPLHDLMMSADIIAGHNINGFDIKKANTRFLINGFEPVQRYDGKKKPTIDTLSIARQRFAFEDNRLDALCKKFGINGKDEVTADDWRAILRGDEKTQKETLSKILKYNKGDVINGLDLLNILLPYSGMGETYGAMTVQDDKSRWLAEVVDEIKV